MFAVKLSNNFGDGEHSISGKNEFTRFQLKEREERILRLERKLQKLQSRLLKKQQDHDLSVALHHVTPGIASTGIDETRVNEKKSLAAGLIFTNSSKLPLNKCSFKFSI